MQMRVSSPPDKDKPYLVRVSGVQRHSRAGVELIGTTSLAAQIQAPLIFPGADVSDREDLFAEAVRGQLTA